MPQTFGLSSCLYLDLLDWSCHLQGCFKWERPGVPWALSPQSTKQLQGIKSAWMEGNPNLEDKVLGVGKGKHISHSFVIFMDNPVGTDIYLPLPYEKSGLFHLIFTTFF